MDEPITAIEVLIDARVRRHLRQLVRLNLAMAGLATGDTHLDAIVSAIVARLDIEIRRQHQPKDITGLNLK